MSVDAEEASMQKRRFYAEEASMQKRRFYAEEASMQKRRFYAEEALMQKHQFYAEEASMQKRRFYADITHGLPASCSFFRLHRQSAGKTTSCQWVPAISVVQKRFPKSL